MASDNESPTVEDYISEEELAGYLGIPITTLKRVHGLRAITFGQNSKYRIYSKRDVADWLRKKGSR